MNYNRLILFVLCVMMGVSSYSQIYSSLEKTHRQITHTPDYQFRSVNTQIFTQNNTKSMYDEPAGNHEAHRYLYEERLARGLFNTVASELRGGKWTTDYNSNSQNPRGPQRSPGVPREEEEQLPLDFDGGVGLFLALLAFVFGRKKVLSSAKQQTC